MRFSTMTAAAAAVGAASAASMSICDKYTTALLTDNTAANQMTLLTLLVKTAALGNFTGNGTVNPKLPGSMISLPGFLAPATYMGESVNLAQYFTGALQSTNRGGMPVAVNFLDGGNSTDLVTMPTYSGPTSSNQYALLTHLYSYFGILLGCSGVGMSGFPAYAGVNSQYTVHKYMDLSEAEFSYFIAQVGAAATSFGASTADVNTVAMSLNSTFGYRCAPAAMVVPDTTAVQNVICIGDNCPLASNANCVGEAAVSGFTASSPATATSTYMSMSSAATTGSAMTTGTDAMTTGMMTTGTGAAESASASTGAAAPLQSAAAGLMAGAAAVAVALL